MISAWSLILKQSLESEKSDRQTVNVIFDAFFLLLLCSNLAGTPSPIRGKKNASANHTAEIGDKGYEV